MEKRPLPPAQTGGRPQGKPWGLDHEEWLSMEEPWALAGRSEAIYKGPVSSLLLLKGQATLSSLASACHVLVLTHRTQHYNSAQVPRWS